ncbi:MAG: hypothetical protein DRI98_11130 [Bacteroidetes bacterium]|nr:MAG: hypothetical protein DRI98_11130 [Bacteroidota bacterium]
MVNRLTKLDKLLLGRMGSYERYCDKREDVEVGICPFCVINQEKNEVLFENDHWIIWEVPQNFSRRASKLFLYLIIVPKSHLYSLAKKDSTFWIQFGEMIDWAYANYDIPGGMLNIRLGDPVYSAATETHPHWNLKVPNLTDEVREAIAKSPEHAAGNNARGKRYSGFYTYGVTPYQFKIMVDQNIVDKKGNWLIEDH